MRVKFEAPQFDLSSNGSMRDAFEVLVVDANNRPLAQPYRYGKDSSYNWSEQLPPLIAGGSESSVGSGTVFSSATINLTGLAVGTPIKVIARLLNNDHDDATSVVIHSVEFVTASGSVPNGMAPDQNNRESLPEVRFNTLTDVTSTFDVQYGRTTLTGDPSIISTDFQLTNAASLPVRGNLIAVVHSDADSTASLLNPDGFMPDGSPYLNLTNLAPQGVAPGETIASKSMQFRIQSQTRFSYRLDLLSGFNQSPTIASLPAADVLVGKQSAWQLNATDPDGDVLTYSIVTGPAGLSVDAQTGRMQWTPTGADIGRWSVQVSAADRFGAKAVTSFQINVRPDIPNRPPVITSTPSTDAQITSPFEVLTYPLGSGPVAADVLPTTGGLADIITANAGDQQLGMLKGQSNTLSGTQSISIGEPAPSLYPSSFITGLNVPIDLVPNSPQNINRDIQGVLTADVNQDSIPDVIVAASINSNGSLGNTNEAGYVIVRLGNGDGTFREGWRTTLPAVSSKTNRVARIQWVEVTGDSLPDLIVTELVGNQALVYPGQSTGLPAMSPIVSALTGSLIVSTQIADMNRDGRLDLVTIENQGNNGGRSGIGIQFGDGAGRFSGLTFVAAENDFGGLGYVADLDGINGPDLVRLNYNNTRLETWLNDGTGQFGSMISNDFRAYLSSTDSNGRLLNPTSAYIDDFNGDGKVDALVTGYQSVVLLSGQGNGRFGDRTEQGNKVLVVDDGDSPQWSNISQTDGRAPDVDGNGLPDFVFGDGSSEGNIMIGLQQPDRSFRITQYNSFFNDDTGIGTKKSGQGNPYVVIADFNRDGINDALTATLSDSTQPASVGIFLGDKPGTLRAPNFVNSYSATDYRVDRGRGGFSVAGDFDNDGHEDIVTAAGTRFDQAFFFAAGHGDGSFEPYQIASSLINSVNSLKAVDIDRDGNLDLVWIDGSNSGAAFGLGNGAFQMMPGLILDGSQLTLHSKRQVSDFNVDRYRLGDASANRQHRYQLSNSHGCPAVQPDQSAVDRLSDHQEPLDQFSSPRRLLPR
ncbi:MAG: FG-GAP-like repeat-containing protein [Pirellulales bacterium]